MISEKQRKLDARYGVVRRRGRCGGRPTVGESRLTCQAVLAFVVGADGRADMATSMYPSSVATSDVERVIAWALQTPERWR